MATRLFNGSTLTFGNAAVARLVGLQVSVSGNPVDVTEPNDENKLFEVSPQEDYEVTARVKRVPTLSQGAKGTLAVTFADGSSLNLPGTWQATKIDASGDWDQPIAGSITFKPTVPDN